MWAPQIEPGCRLRVVMLCFVYVSDPMGNVIGSKPDRTKQQTNRMKNKQTGNVPTHLYIVSWQSFARAIRDSLEYIDLVQLCRFKGLRARAGDYTSATEAGKSIGCTRCGMWHCENPNE